MKGRFHLRLPATSANLGPAFDTAAVALSLYLDVMAEPADEFSISAQGRDAAACGRLQGNLILETYRRLLSSEDRAIVPLRLEVRNEIPLGMGCGSSAAARLAGIALAVEFGQLDWRAQQVVDVATGLEGHPDNVSACWFGGMTVSAVSGAVSTHVADDSLGPKVHLPQVSVARFSTPQHWRPVLVLPRESIRTEESRKVLPEHYCRADIVANLQHTALLVAAFATGNSTLLQAAMHDRVHQPYRSAICPILEQLQDMAQAEGFLGVVLSGAGPGVLLVIDESMKDDRLRCLLQGRLGNLEDTEVIHCRFENEGVEAISRTRSF